MKYSCRLLIFVGFLTGCETTVRETRVIEKAPPPVIIEKSQEPIIIEKNPTVIPKTKIKKRYKLQES
ncbi:MAG: hypothetical protein BGO67_10805 [Alphaproteobacteria bacterium 41-28]|nr:MAG: hypothetical protein BGO67_10805 [Alphaproteobacteria bacterium 41-28]